MQQMFQTRDSQLRKIEKIDQICSLSKDFKDSIIGVSPGFLFSTNIEGCIYKRMVLNTNNPSFIFSTNQLKTNSAKLLIQEPDNAYLFMDFIIREEFIDIIKSGAYYLDQQTQDLMEVGTGIVIPCIKTGPKDQFFEYHDKFDKRFDYVFASMCNFDLVDIPCNSGNFEVFENFQDYTVFKDMIDKKKEWGTFKAHFVSPTGMVYIASFYKNMIPYKKGDKISVVFTKSDLSSFSYDAMFTIHRKNHVPIQVYCRYLNLLRK